MVRTLDSALTTALNSVTRRPALTLTIEDHVIHYAAYQNPGTGDALHDACIASDNSIVRCYVSRNSFTSTCYVQRITDPTVASQWSTWTALSGSTNSMFQDGGIAISKWPDNSLHLYAGQGTGGNSIYNWYSSARKHRRRMMDTEHLQRLGDYVLKLWSVAPLSNEGDASPDPLSENNGTNDRYITLLTK
jgi:hypothetical protein